MGLDTKIIIKPSFSPEDVESILKSIGAEHVLIDNTHCPSYKVIRFEYKGEMRSISFFFNMDNIFDGNLISLSCFGFAQEILIKIVKLTGGLYCAEDSSENWEMYNGIFQESNGIPYFYKWGVINGYIKNDNDWDGLAAAKTAWEEKINK